MLKIKFKISERYDSEIMKKFSLPKKGDWNWSNHIFFFYPDIKEKLSKRKTRKEKEQIIDEYVCEFYSKNKNRLEVKRRFLEKN
jgi:hypothetical protein